MSDFIKELETLINRYSKDSASDTPDFVLADYMTECLESYTRAIARKRMHGGSYSDNNTLSYCQSNEQTGAKDDG